MKAKFINEISFERGKDPKRSMEIGLGEFKRIMDDHGFEPAELRMTRDRLDNFTGWGDKDGFERDLEIAVENPWNWNIDPQSGYYDDIKWGLENIDDAWELVNVDNSEIYPDHLEEAANFERGKDPKAQMGIGIGWENLSPGTIIKLQKDLPRINKFKGDLFRIKKITNLGSPFDKRISYIPVDKNFNELRKWASSWDLSKDFFEKTFTLGGISESISFERGKDPKDTIGIGNRLARAAEKNGISYDDAREIVHVLRVLFPDDFTQEEFDMNVFQIANELDMSELREYGLHPEDSNFATVKWVDNNIQKGWELYSAAVKDSGITESVNFERGKEPKYSMGLGVKDQIKKAIVDMVGDKHQPIYKIDYYDENSYVNDHLKNTLKLEFASRPSARWPKELIVEPVEDYLSDYVETPYDSMYFGDPGTESYYFKVRPKYLEPFRRAFLEAVAEFVIPR